jgi:hypothetical protein
VKRGAVYDKPPSARVLEDTSKVDLNEILALSRCDAEAPKRRGIRKKVIIDSNVLEGSHGARHYAQTGANLTELRGSL